MSNLTNPSMELSENKKPKIDLKEPEIKQPKINEMEIDFDFEEEKKPKNEENQLRSNQPYDFESRIPIRTNTGKKLAVPGVDLTGIADTRAVLDIDLIEIDNTESDDGSSVNIGQELSLDEIIARRVEEARNRGDIQSVEF